MKKILYFLIFIISLVLVDTSCKIDNYPYPDAQFFGAIRDSVGGGLVEQDLQTGSVIGAYEAGYPTPTLQNWVIKNSGEFRNNYVYANTYDIVFQSCNFFPYQTWVDIKAGANEHDFLVTPFIRVKNASITLNTATNKIVATFTLEAGKPSVKVGKISLYAWTDIYVGEYIKTSLATGTGQPTQTLTGAAQTINPSTTYTLSIDLAANATVFAIKRNYYFRVGAIAIQSGVGTIRTNYAPLVKIPL
jgi:hypothetical protein